MRDPAKKRGNINQNILWKRGMVPEQRFFMFPQCCRKFEKKKILDSRNAEKDRKDRNQHNQQRNKKNDNSRSR